MPQKFSPYTYIAYGFSLISSLFTSDFFSNLFKHILIFIDNYFTYLIFKSQIEVIFKDMLYIGWG